MRRLAALAGLLASAAASAAEPAPVVRLLVGSNSVQLSLDPQRSELYLDLPLWPSEALELRLRGAVAAVPQEPAEFSTGPSVGVDATVDLVARWTPSGWAAGEGVWVQLSPLGSPRLQLGVDPLLRMGASVPKQVWPLAGAVGVEREGWSGRFAVKSVAFDAAGPQGGPSRFQSLFAQVGRSSPKGWSFDAGVARISTAVVGLGLQVLLAPADALAGAARVIYRSNGEIGAPLDLDRLRKAPWGQEAVFAPSTPRPARGLEVVAEGIWGTETLRSLATLGLDPLTPVPQRLYGGRASARLAMDPARIQLGTTLRSPSLLLADSFGDPPFAAFLPETVRFADLWIDASVDRELPELGLTPGVLLRVRRHGARVGPQAFGAVTFDPRQPQFGTTAPGVGWSLLFTGRWTPVRYTGVFAQVGVEYGADEQVKLGSVVLPGPVAVLRADALAQLAF